MSPLPDFFVPSSSLVLPALVNQLCFNACSQSFPTNSPSVSPVIHQSILSSIVRPHPFPDTTRSPRPGETDGKQYHFVSRDSFLQLIDQGAFIEHAEFSGNFYGTSFQAVNSISDLGRRCILDIEVQGVRQIKNTSLNPVYLFVSPPSLATLRSRLVARGTESQAAVDKRMKTALNEISYAKEPGPHDVVIVNDDLDRAYALFKKVALGEKPAGDVLPPLDD